MRARHPPNPSIDLTIVEGSIITPKPIWRYLGFFFDQKLNFYYYTHFYTTKCLSTLSAMKMLGNFSWGLLPIQKRLLYRTCILPIVLYGFNLWFFKGTLIVKNVNKYNVKQLFESLVLSEHPLLMALKPLQASSLSLSICKNLIAGTILDMAPSYPHMPLICY